MTFTQICISYLVQMAFLTFIYPIFMRFLVIALIFQNGNYFTFQYLHEEILRILFIINTYFVNLLLCTHLNEYLSPNLFHSSLAYVNKQFEEICSCHYQLYTCSKVFIIEQNTINFYCSCLVVITQLNKPSFHLGPLIPRHLGLIGHCHLLLFALPL